MDKISGKQIAPASQMQPTFIDTEFSEPPNPPLLSTSINLSNNNDSSEPNPQNQDTNNENSIFFETSDDEYYPSWDDDSDFSFDL